MEFFDTILLRATHPLVTKWCSVTGRDNYSLARILLLSGGCFLFAYHVLRIRTGDYWSVIGLIVWPWITRTLLGICRRVAESARRRSEVIGLTPHDVWRLRWDGMLFFFFATVDFVALRPQALGFVMLGVGCYVVRHHNGGGKSLVRRALDRVRARVPVLGVAPSPA